MNENGSNYLAACVQRVETKNSQCPSFLRDNWPLLIWGTICLSEVCLSAVQNNVFVIGGILLTVLYSNFVIQRIDNKYSIPSDSDSVIK